MTAYPRRTRAFLRFWSIVCVAVLVLPVCARAGFGFQAVWYPDGVIRWYAETTPGPLPYLRWSQVESVIIPTMEYMSERLPLDIEQVETTGESNLMFKKSIYDGTGPCCAWTYGYWNPGGWPKDIAFFDDRGINRQTTGHEFGHALGMPHEFQRADAQALLTIDCEPDPFNYGVIPGLLFGDVRMLSPFDVHSRMMYRKDCVTINATGTTAPFPRYRRTGIQAIYSSDDLNSIYRVYARALGKNDPADRFGHATDVFDLDDDGFEDIVVATNDRKDASTRQLNLYFYRGVAADPSEGGAGRRYMPWFAHTVADGLPDTEAWRAERMSLASGDFDSDGRIELAVGYPAKGDGRAVAIYAQALPEAFPADEVGSEPWAVKGLRLRQTITPSDVDSTLVGGETFGRTLAVGRLTKADRDDLVIGWPTARRAGTRFLSVGAVVHLRGWADEPKPFLPTPPLDTGNPAIIFHPGDVLFTLPGRPAPPNPDFGAAIALVQGSRAGALDTLAVGAPGEQFHRGSVYIYGSSAGPLSRPAVPELLAVLEGQPRSRFGHALASIDVEKASDSERVHTLVVGAPEEEIRNAKGGNTIAGAVYHYGIEADADPVVTELGRLTSPPHRLGGQMQWGHALAVLQQGNDYEGVQVGIGAPGAASGEGLVYAWRPFGPAGEFSTAGASLTAPSSTGRRYGQTLHEIAFATDKAERRGFAIGAPTGIADGVGAGYVQARLNRESLPSGQWSSDRQKLTQTTTGDHTPD